MKTQKLVIEKLKEILKYERDCKVGLRTYYPATMKKLESELTALESSIEQDKKTEAQIKKED